MIKKTNKVRAIALYLPQFHPIPENDEWWGKGFTEWTNVGKARPLFWGHYQPRIPADLGYYDLRLPEVRELQADLAKEAGIEGFCYWHYWFNGKRLLEKPFNEVLESGKPDFPFCLCWANHSWYAKNWNKDVPDKLLLEQTYPGKIDYENHFYAMLPAFKDDRYLKVNDKPIFGVYAYKSLPDTKEFIETWNNLAIKNGLKGFYFFTISFKKEEFNFILKQGFDAIVYDTTFVRESFMRYFHLFLHKIKFMPQVIDFNNYAKTLIKNMPVDKKIIPSITANYDHSPRSGRRGSVMINSSPMNLEKLMKKLLDKIKQKTGEDNIVILKSWNEWAEGNYLEPDLKHGKGYINSLKKVLRSDSKD